MARKRTTSKAEFALNTLGADIIRGAIPAGSRFTLATISERFNISRTIAREVMRTLEHCRMVTSSPRVGLKVLPRHDWWVLDPRVISWRLSMPEERDPQLRSLTCLRLAIEPQAARGMARMGSPEAIGELLSLGDELYELGKAGKGATDEFLDKDIAFHVTILRNSGNEMFEALSPTIATVLEGRVSLGLQPAYPSDEALIGHQQLAKAIADGDGPAAERAAYDLLEDVRISLGLD